MYVDVDRVREEAGADFARLDYMNKGYLVTVGDMEYQCIAKSYSRFVVSGNHSHEELTEIEDELIQSYKNSRDA